MSTNIEKETTTTSTKVAICPNIVDFMKKSQNEILEDFFDYVESKHQEENILFLQSLEKYKEILQIKNDKSKEIYDTYLKPGSYHEINVDEKMLSEITEDNLETDNIFTTLETTVIQLANTSILPSYLSSERYRQIILELENAKKSKLIFNSQIKIDFIPGKRRESDPLSSSVIKKMGSSFSLPKRKYQKNFRSTGDLPYSDALSITFGTQYPNYDTYKVTASGRLQVGHLIQILLKEVPDVYSNDNPNDEDENENENDENVGIWVETLSMWLSSDEPLSTYSKYLGEKTKNIFRLKKKDGDGK